MQFDENIIRNVVAQVLAEVGPMPKGSANTAATAGGSHGVFYDADSAVSAARAAFEQFRDRTMEDRKRVIDIIRRISIEQCEELGLM